MMTKENASGGISYKGNVRHQAHDADIAQALDAI